VSPIYKLSANSLALGRTNYRDFLMGNAVFNPWSPQGAMDALATVTVPSGGTSSITFSAIPQTGYSHLQIRAIARNNNSGGTSGYDQAILTFNGDTGNNYSDHYLEANGSGSPYAGSGTSQTGIWTIAASRASFTTNVFGAGIVDILDYTSVNKNKTVRTLTGIDNNGSGFLTLFSGSWLNSSSPVNSITLVPQGSLNFVQNSQFSLYGIK
jgi:hypothetical protein